MAIQRSVKLTKRTVDAATPHDKTFILFDSMVPGFGLRVQPSGVKAFTLEYRPSAARGVNKRRITLGRFGPMTVDQARRAALDALATIGINPADDKVRERASQPLSIAIDHFLAEHVEAKRKLSTASWCRGILTRTVKPALGAMVPGKVTRQDVARLHASMHDRPVQANRVLEVISALYGYAGKAGYVTEGYNPARGVDRFRERPRQRFLSTEELARLGAALHEADTISTSE